MVLAPEDLLIHLALNFFLDRRFRSGGALRQLCDVSESIRYYRESIDWQLFLDNVDEYRLSGPVGLVLHLAALLLGARVPTEVSQQLGSQRFTTHQVERFLRRRVLDARNWVWAARPLGSPDGEYRSGREDISALRHFIPRPCYFGGRPRKPVSGARGLCVYTAHTLKRLGVLRYALIRPREMWEDLAIERWHHSLCGYKQSGSH